MFDLRLHSVAHKFLRIGMLFRGFSSVDGDCIPERARLRLLDHKQAESPALLMDGAGQAADALALGEPSRRHVKRESQALVGVGIAGIAPCVEAWRSRRRG